MNGPAFFDCVNDPHSRWGTFIENYFYLEGISEKFGTRKYTCINDSDGVRETKPNQTTSCKDWIINGLKIGSYLIGLPIFMLLGKRIFRSSHNYSIISPKKNDESPPAPPPAAAKAAAAASSVLPQQNDAPPAPAASPQIVSIEKLKEMPFDEEWKKQADAFVQDLKIKNADKRDEFLFDTLSENHKKMEKAKYEYLCQQAPSASLFYKYGCFSYDEVVRRNQAGLLTQQDRERYLNSGMLRCYFLNQGVKAVKNTLAELPPAFLALMAANLSNRNCTDIPDNLFRIYRALLQIIISTPHPDKEARILAFLRGAMDDLMKCLYFKAEFKNLAPEEQTRLKEKMTDEERKVLSIPIELTELVDRKPFIDYEKPTKEFHELTIEEMQIMRPIWLIELTSNDGASKSSKEQIDVLIEQSKKIENGHLLVAWQFITRWKSGKTSLDEFSQDAQADLTRQQRLLEWMQKNKEFYSQILKSLSPAQAEQLEEFKNYCFKTEPYYNSDNYLATVEAFLKQAS